MVVFYYQPEDGRPIRKTWWSFRKKGGGILTLLDYFTRVRWYLIFVGPTPPKPNEPIGSAGPTTSYRMDSYSPTMLKHGSKGMIGKGKRDQAVKDACVEYGGVYFGATGGAGALLGKKILSAKVIAYPELGPEAVRKLVVKDFPVTVINDTYGDDLYQMGREQYEVKD